jgi:hypothetical protein
MYRKENFIQFEFYLPRTGVALLFIHIKLSPALIKNAFVKYAELILVAVRPN